MWVTHDQNRIAVTGIVVLSFLFLVTLATPSFAETKSQSSSPPAARQSSHVVSIIRLVMDSVLGNEINGNQGNNGHGENGNHGHHGEDPASPFHPPGKPPDRPPHHGPPPDPPGRPPDRPPDHSHGDRD